MYHHTHTHTHNVKASETVRRQNQAQLHGCVGLLQDPTLRKPQCTK